MQKDTRIGRQAFATEPVASVPCRGCMRQQSRAVGRVHRAAQSHRALRVSFVTRASADTKETDTKAAKRKEKEQGRTTYSPASYKELVTDAVDAVDFALDDGVKRLEVDFPTLSGDSEQLSYLLGEAGGSRARSLLIEAI